MLRLLQFCMESWKTGEALLIVKLNRRRTLRTVETEAPVPDIRPADVQPLT